MKLKRNFLFSFTNESDGGKSPIPAAKEVL